MKKVLLYTDGACSGNPGKGGYGTVLIYKDKRREMSAGYKETTNNRMELMGVIAGLEALKEPCEIVLTSDSKYVIDALKLGWVIKWKENGWMRTKKEKAKNADLWERLLSAAEPHKMEYVWVKGHAGHPENERCDFLAVSAYEGDNLMLDENYQK